MYLQNNKELLPLIQSVGCLYLSILKMVELITGLTISIEDVNAIWTSSMNQGQLKPSGYMVNIDGVFQIAKRVLGYKQVICSIGIEENGKELYWQWTMKDKKLQKYKYKIENLKTNGKEGNHFVLCNPDNVLAFDSYSFKTYESRHIGRYHLFNYWY